jgi:hypothetical protein
MKLISLSIPVFTAVLMQSLIMHAEQSLAVQTDCRETPIALGAQAIESPDLILMNGKVATLVDDFTVAQALSVKDGRILSIGGDAEVLKTTSNATGVIDLAGLWGGPQTPTKSLRIAQPILRKRVDDIRL